MYILLTSATFEQFPTEVRGSSVSLCMCLGLLGGLGLAFFDGLTNTLMISMLMLFGVTTISLFFLRETSKEEALKNMYYEIIKDKDDNTLDHLMRNDNDLEVRGNGPNIGEG